MEEINHNTENISKENDIFSLKNKEIAISCIFGDDSSPKITKLLNQQGYNQISCLSGGIKGLTEHFDDNDVFISDIKYEINHFTCSKKIFRQTGMLPTDYYSGLDEKILLIITHKEFENLENTITENKLFSLGVKEIYYFDESTNLEKFVNKNYPKK